MEHNAVHPATLLQGLYIPPPLSACAQEEGRDEGDNEANSYEAKREALNVSGPAAFLEAPG